MFTKVPAAEIDAAIDEATNHADCEPWIVGVGIGAAGFRKQTRVCGEPRRSVTCVMSKPWRWICCRLVRTFDSFHARYAGNTWNRDRALFVMTRNDAMAMTGSSAGFIFSYREPVLQFSPAEQSLLAAAVGGLTDEELARKLVIKLPTIEKRWASIFERVGVIRPDLVSVAEHSVLERLARGRQKRHHLLAYLREHPEELRPIELSRACRNVLNPATTHQPSDAQSRT